MSVCTGSLHQESWAPYGSAAGDRARLGVAVTYQVYGVTVAVHATDARHWEAALDALPLYPGLETRTAPDLRYTIVWDDESFSSVGNRQHSLYRDAERLYSTRDAETLLHALQVDVVRSIAVTARDHIFVHAGAVTYRGRGILLPGVSGAGKSTLVRYLLERGAQYYSDEYAVLDRRGKLHPFPCRLRLGASPDSKRPYAYQQLGAVAGNVAARVACVAFPTYGADAHCAVEAMPRSSAALHLLAHAPRTRTRPKEAMTAAVMATRGAQCFRVRYSNCAEVAEVLFSAAACSSLARHDARRQGEKTWLE